MALVDVDLYVRVRHLFPEMLKFGVVGGIGAVFDLGGAALLHGSFHVEALLAKGISTITAMVITYLGSRYWTFKGHEDQELKRQATLFISLNLVGLLMAEAVVGLVTYAMGMHSELAYNVASFLGTGLGTIFRYVTYRKWVFPAPDQETPATSALVPQASSDYPPWELDPTFLGTPVPETTSTPADPARDSAPDPAYSLPWEPESASAWDPALAPTLSWSAPPLPPAPVPQPLPQPQPAAAPAPGLPATAFSTPAWEASAPVKGTHARARATHRPAHARSPMPRLSGTGRHRKS